MRITLVRPPFYSMFGVTAPRMKTYPLNLLYLATFARDMGGHAVTIVDGEALTYPGMPAAHREADPGNAVHQGIAGMLAILHDPDHPLWVELERRILEDVPELVGISCNSGNMDTVRVLVARLRRHGLPTILGGSHPTALPEQSILYTGADMVAIGEGERTLVRVAEALEGDDRALAGVPSLAYAANGGLRINPRGELIQPIDSLPIPDRSFVDRAQYFGDAIMTGRGCPFDCLYCASRNIWGKRVRLRSVESILAELEMIRTDVERYLGRNVADMPVRMENERHGGALDPPPLTPNAGDLSLPATTREPLPSFRRKTESSLFRTFWTPPSAGVTSRADRSLLESQALPLTPPARGEECRNLIYPTRGGECRVPAPSARGEECRIPSLDGRGKGEGDPTNPKAPESHSIPERWVVKVLDDTFTVNRNRTLALLDAIVAAGLDCFEFTGGVRADTLTDTLVRKMVRAGFSRVTLGVESGSPRMLKMIRKGETNEDVKRAMELLRNAGIKSHAFFMIGLPGETPEDIELSKDLIREVRPDHVEINMVTPYPGTDLFPMLIPEDPMKIDRWYRWFHQGLATHSDRLGYDLDKAYEDFLDFARQYHEGK